MLQISVRWNSNPELLSQQYMYSSALQYSISPTVPNCWSVHVLPEAGEDVECGVEVEEPGGDVSQLQQLTKDDRPLSWAPALQHAVHCPVLCLQNIGTKIQIQQINVYSIIVLKVKDNY